MKVATKLKVRFIDLIRPDCYPAYTLDQRMGIFRWMVRTAEQTQALPGDAGRWGTCTALDLLSAKPTCVNACRVDPILSLADLDQRFHYALLSRFAGRMACRWRHENRIGITETRWVYMPFRKFETPVDADMWGSSARHSSGPSGLWSPGRSEADIEQLFRSLIEAKGQKTREQLNPYHAGANTVQEVRMGVSGEGYRFYFSYGYPKDSSNWAHDLNAPADEPFLASLDRAAEEMARVTDWTRP